MSFTVVTEDLQKTQSFIICKSIILQESSLSGGAEDLSFHSCECRQAEHRALGFLSTCLSPLGGAHLPEPGTTRAFSFYPLPLYLISKDKMI
jgi:hypothetical protein